MSEIESVNISLFVCLFLSFFPSFFLSSREVYFWGGGKGKVDCVDKIQT